MPNLLPNKFPTLDQPYRLAIVGESPTYEDITIGSPFTGTRGKFLHAALSKSSILSSALFLGHLHNYEHDIEYDYRKRATLPTDTALFQSSRQTLKEDLTRYAPNCILLLGPETLRAAGIDHSLDSFRGSIFQCRNTDSPFFGFKCVATYNPQFLIKAYDAKPLFDFDVKRAKDESTSPELNLPERHFSVELSSDQIISRLDSITPGTWTSIDIEGGVPNPEATKPEYRFPNGITCIGIATSPSSAFIVAPNDFDVSAQIRIYQALARVLCNPLIPKVLQNSLYDNFALSWLWKMPIRNVVWDTMLGFWQMFPELPKSLGTQVSLLTRTPYYKFERKIDDKLTHYRYCCMDAAVTLEIAEKQQAYLSQRPPALAHHEFNMSLLPALLYMELRGIRYNTSLAAEKLAETTSDMAQLQCQINTMAGVPLNVNSPKQMTDVLYKRLGFEPQYRIERGRKTNTTTTDADALLTLFKKSSSPLIYNILRWRQLEGNRKQLEINADPDGRVRCAYNAVGTDTGRLTCYESPTGSGANLQTIMSKFRIIYQADPGMTMFQCDLSGADGWTVAAWSKALGDPTMWDDYEAGIKPALVIAAMYLHGKDVTRLSRDKLRVLCEEVKHTAPEWLYPACKAVQHGSNYGMGTITMSKNILLQSWKKAGKPIYVSSTDCGKLQNLYLNYRYTGIQAWQRRVKEQIEKRGTLTSCSGHTRTFFGRLSDNATHQTALSQEPQAVTTYVTNLALRNLWYDENNRRADDSLIIEPLHQVHDALVGQFPTELLAESKARIIHYFSNPITVAGLTFTIPFEGKCGDSWGNLNDTI